MALLLQTLVPWDSMENETEYHFQVREESAAPQNLNIEPPFQMYELEKVLKDTKPRKAAGPDLLPPEIFRNYDQNNKEALLELLNAC